jgi:hypothetical protein
VSTYERAREVFEREGHAAARPLFAQADSCRPGGDPPSRVHMAWCDELARSGGATKDSALSVSK